MWPALADAAAIGWRPMPKSESPRLLLVHAHPDDECLTTGGTIARYAARGADVRVITCTLGEEGEVIGERFRYLAVDHADQLGGYRYAELTNALEALGSGAPMLLGGVGRWRDSGMEGTPPRRQTRFIDAGAEAVDELAAAVDRDRELDADLRDVLRQAVASDPGRRLPP